MEDNVKSFGMEDFVMEDIVKSLKHEKEGI